MPFSHCEQLNYPVIFFQGLDDKVVPPNQAEDMVKVLTEKGIATVYISFAGEGHGFWQGHNIKRALEGELYFYSRIFGFEVDSEIESVDLFPLNSSVP